MNLSLSLLTVQIQKQNKKVKHFKCCPACGSNELIVVGPETLCVVCDWETTLQSVQQGDMDQIFKACKEQFKGDVCLL